MDKAIERIREERNVTVAGYTDYTKMLEDESVEAVLIVSSWDEHIRMAIQSMRAGKITACEVGGAYDVEECWELVRTYEETKTPIMFLENCCFDKFELLSTTLVRLGMLGEVVHCHGAYSHDLRDEICGGIVNRHYLWTTIKNATARIIRRTKSVRLQNFWISTAAINSRRSFLILPRQSDWKSLPRTSAIPIRV